MSLQAAILIVSDTASKDPSTDKCEGVLKEVFSNAASESAEWHIQHIAIVPDDVLTIQRKIREWTDSDDYVNLIVTSGGTGFATKDVTPEVGHRCYPSLCLFPHSKMPSYALG